MIIDFHTHIFPDAIASRTVEALGKSCNIPYHSNGRADGLGDKLQEAGVDLAVNLPALTAQKQFDSVLRFADQLNREQAEGGRILSFAGMHPDCPDPEEAIERITALGIKGIKLHPDYQRCFFDDERYLRILKVAKRHGLITVTHAGVDGAFIGEPIKCTPDRVLRVLDKLGGYDRLVLAHLGGNDLQSEVLDLLAGEDVYFDTAYVLDKTDKDYFYRLLQKHSADRILFATDSPWRDIKTDVSIINDFLKDSPEREKILSGNARRLLKV